MRKRKSTVSEKLSLTTLKCKNEAAQQNLVHVLQLLLHHTKVVVVV